MIVLGIVFALTGLLLIISFILKRIKCSSKTEATVSRIETKSIPLRGTKAMQYTPVFTYSLNGTEYTEKADLSTGRKGRFYVGQKCTVLVDPNHPEHVRYGSELGFLLPGLIFALAGILIIVLSFT